MYQIKSNKCYLMEDLECILEKRHDVLLHRTVNPSFIGDNGSIINLCLRCIWERFEYVLFVTYSIIQNKISSEM